MPLFPGFLVPVFLKALVAGMVVCADPPQIDVKEYLPDLKAMFFTKSHGHVCIVFFNAKFPFNSFFCCFSYSIILL